MNRHLAAICTLTIACTSPVFAGGIDSDAPYLFKTRQAKPVEYQRRAPNLEEMIQRSDLPFSQMQPIPLRGVRIQGLLPKAVEQLGFNYFVVVENSGYLKMSDIYRESRLAGKSNFVTADSVIHPYLAFTNRVLSDSIQSGMVPDLQYLLAAMQEFSLIDYNSSEDADVREDIERNIAYLAVALKLLDARYEIPSMGKVPQLADKDLKNIFAGRLTRSAIFDRDEDFSQFKPSGFYNTDDRLRSYFRCREWLSRIPYPVIDVSAGVEGRQSNNFRRSVLLFRALDHATVQGKPAMELWTKLVKASTLLGTPLDNLKERTLGPTDYLAVFQDRQANLKVTLNALAEPLFRTKLMLAIRKQKPMNLTSASIFELEDGASETNSTANFRLFPMVAQPEQPWLKMVARRFPTDGQSSSAWPIGLLDMYAWGSPIAGNILSDNMWSLDPNIAHALPELVKCVMRRLPGGQMQPVDSRSWKILSTYFKSVPESVPGALRTENWMTRRLLSALGGWVDAQCAIAPLHPGAANVAAVKAAAAAASQGTADAPETASAEGVTGVPTTPEVSTVPRRISKTVPYHYLEPMLDLYKLLEQDAAKLQAELATTKYLNDKYKLRFSDFTRLFVRLQKITEAEIRGQQLTVVDKRLLGRIDEILSKVDVPLPAVLAVEAPQQAGAANSKPEDHFGHGLNLAIGRPGLLYVIYQNPHSLEWTLGRGAVYTYYEMPAPLLTESMWQHKVEAGFVQPLHWTSRFQVVQKEERKMSTAAAVK